MFLEISVQVMFKLHQLESEPLVNRNLKAIPQMLSQTEVWVFTPLKEINLKVILSFKPLQDGYYFCMGFLTVYLED